MTPAQITQLILILGPPALELVQKLAALWDQELTPDQVKELCEPARKSYDQFIQEAKDRLVKL